MALVKTLKALIKQNEEFAELELVKKSPVASNYVRGKLDAFKNILMIVNTAHTE